MNKIKYLFLVLILILSFNNRSFSQFCFDPKVSYNSAINPSSLCVADFNEDSIVDLAVANINSGSGNISIHLGDGIGGFQIDTTISTGALPGSICTNDFNRDNHADLATFNYGPGTVTIFLGDGTGNFIDGVVINTGLFHKVEIYSADFNNDTIPDLVMPSTFNYLMVALGTGNGNFNPFTQFTADNGTHCITSADFNNDGNLDLATGTFNATNHATVLFGNGLGGFGTPANFVVSDNIVGLVTGDFNRDHKMDLASVNSHNNTSGNLSVLLGDGTGSFASTLNFNIGDSTVPQDMYTADFNNDSILDLAIAGVYNNMISRVTLLKGDGLGGFMAPVNFNVDSFPNGAISADFNADGKNDLAISASRNNIDSGIVSVLMNCFSTSIEPITNILDQFSIYPNPGKQGGVIYISSSNNIEEIIVTDVLGKVIYSEIPNSNLLELPLQSSGIYIVSVRANKQTVKRKLIVSN